MTVDICIATVIALLIAAFAHNAWRRWRKTKVGDAYRYAAPVSADLARASKQLVLTLNEIVRLHTEIPDGDYVGLISEPASRISRALAEPLTYGKAYSVYKNLCGVDAAYARIADIYIAKGVSTHCEPLVAAGKQLHSIPGQIHRLGVALNVE